MKNKITQTARDPDAQERSAEETLWDAHGWTSVCDDTGGGHSLTNFELLYVQGDLDLAAAAIESGFGVARHAGTQEYGQALSFAHNETFAKASWHERGCGYDSAKKTPIEGPSGDSWREPYTRAEQWIAGCERSFKAARGHQRDWQASRYGKRFLCARVEALALALGWRMSADNDQRGIWTAQLIEAIRDGLAPLETNREVVAQSFADALRVASHIAREAHLGDQERPESWANAANMLRGADFTAARALASNDEVLQEQINSAQLRLAGFPDPSSTASAEEVLAGIGAARAEEMLEIARRSKDFASRHELISALESIALSEAARDAAVGRGGPRL